VIIYTSRRDIAAGRQGAKPWATIWPDASGSGSSFIGPTHLVEELTTDHGEGLNYVRALGYRRKRGKAEFFVDQEIPQSRGRHPSTDDMEWRAYPPEPEEPE
jgi:hypothetical protein